ncbi:MAG: SRPBCC family protein [Bacteroidales bacterium]
MSVYRITDVQELPVPVAEAWDFLSDPRNLARITPPHMGFRIRTPDLPEKVHPGLLITYRVKVVPGLPVTWVTEITHVDEGRYFVDEQRIGPYALWHHEHRLEATDAGCLMRDVVTYKLPLGILGRLAHSLFVKRQLRTIFDYRRRALEGLFPDTVPGHAPANDPKDSPR